MKMDCLHLRLVLLLALLEANVEASSGACPQEDVAALLQGGVGVQQASRHAAKVLQMPAASFADVSSSATEASEQKEHPAGWFGDFDQAESTYTSEGLDSSKSNPEQLVKLGFDPALPHPQQNPPGMKSVWFDESSSGGAKVAWQTNYPALASAVAGNAVKANSWRETPTGWVQDYLEAAHGVAENSAAGLISAAGPNSAAWFDSSVSQIDGFGRQKEPGVNDVERYVGGHWRQRSVNASLTCKAPGCTAKGSLQLFDVSKEEAHLCRLSIHVHPTDYDDEAREHIEHWKINGRVAMKKCSPRASSCNAAAQNALYPCLNDFSVDHLIDNKGALALEGKNTPMVDECPHMGNLLSGVATATCMVRDKKYNLLYSKKTEAKTVHGEALLHCKKPGCTAETTVFVGPSIQPGMKCVMNITVHQTDFDDKVGAPEQIDFIQVEGANITSAPVQPGKNPCNSASKGQNVTDADRMFAAVQNYDLTKLMNQSHHSGALKVRAKISDRVDECGYKANLLYANVTVHCVPPATPR